MEGIGRTRTLQVLRTTNDDPTCLTFVFRNEDHTLGNALRYIILKNPEVRFCSYTIPHPLENKIHFRIETYGTPSEDVLRKGLNDLQDVCAHVLTTFEDTVKDYKNSGGNPTCD